MTSPLLTLRFPVAATLMAAFLSPTAHAIEGKTADGCTYKVINGQYLTQCPSDAKGATNNAPSTYVAPKSSSDTVTSYSAVPMRSNPSAPVPSVQTAPAPVVSVAIETPSQNEQISESYETARKREKDQFEDATYAGFFLGSSSLKNSSSSLGLSGSLGTSIDEHFGVELGYSYSGQSRNIGLSSRGNETDLGSLSPTPTKDDVTIRSHLISGEIQGHITDSRKRLRPFLGAGFGYRMNSLKEKSSQDPFSGRSVSGGSLSQNAFGGLASAGAKLRISKTMQLGFVFRYFFPIASQEAKLESGATSFSGTESRLTSSDSVFTEGGQTQILGGFQVAF